MPQKADYNDLIGKNINGATVLRLIRTGRHNNHNSALYEVSCSQCARSVARWRDSIKSAIQHQNKMSCDACQRVLTKGVGLFGKNIRY